MYHFRKLSGCYNIEVTTTSMGTESRYCSQIQLLGRYRAADNSYVFELQSRQNVLLNDLPATQVADIFMLRLSDTYYPMKLQVSYCGEILNVENYDEIIKRWHDEVSKIMSETPCIAYQQYIEQVKPNVINKRAFLNTIKIDSFIQLFFIDYEKDFTVACYNFPDNGDVSRYLFCKDDTVTIDEKKVYKTTDDQYKGHIECELSDEMEITSLASEFIYLEDNKRSTKSINIWVTERQAKKSNKLISFFTD